MKIFDFEKTGHCPERVAWLKRNFSKRLSEKEFVEIWTGLRQFSRAKHRGSKNSPSSAKNIYKHLKRDFGFFN